MKVVALYSIKGGVGKTTSAVNLAYLAAREGRRTLLWDLDPQAAATFLFRVKPKLSGGADALVRRKLEVTSALRETDFPRLDLLPADFSNRHLDLLLNAAKHSVRRLSRILEPVSQSYDLVVLDCAPSVSLVSEAVLRAADVVVIPVVPAPLAVRTYAQLARVVSDQRQPMGTSHPPVLLPFFSMADRRRQVHRELMEAEGPGASWVAVPASSLVEQMAAVRAPLPTFAPRSPATRAFEELWRAVGAALA